MIWGPLLALFGVGGAVAFVALNKKSSPKDKPIVWTRDTSGRTFLGRAYRIAVTVPQGQGDAMAEALATTGINFVEQFDPHTVPSDWPKGDPFASDPDRCRFGGLATTNAQFPPVGNIVVWTTS